MTAEHQITLHCDMDVCPHGVRVLADTVTKARRYASQDHGWRLDKLGRDICPAHPKLKGSR